MLIPMAQPTRLTDLRQFSRQNTTQAFPVSKRDFHATRDCQHRVAKYCFFLSAVVFASILLQPASARAGTGNFSNGKFNLCVSIRFNASSDQIMRIRQVFEVASQVLADTTDGQHQLGTISIVNNSGASDQAEIWIFPSGARASATTGGYGFRGRHINLFYGTEFAQPNTIRNGLVVIHEFAHHAYGVEDEYYNSIIKNPDGTTIEIPAHCPGADRESPTLSYCIMDDVTKGTRKTSSNYSVNEFCVASNHDKPNADGSGAHDTAQSLRYRNDSCWETASKIQKKWRLALPNGLPQESAPQTQLVTFNENCTAQTQRVVLLIDRSGSMSIDNRLGFAKQASAHFASLVSAGDSLGIVSFSTTASINFPLTPISDNTSRSNAKAALNPLLAEGATNIGDGLLAAMSQLNSQGGCPGCQKTIILLSDGDNNVGPPPQTLLPELQNSGINVIAVTVGSGITLAGESALKDISNQTSGGYFRAATPNQFIQFIVELAYSTGGYRGVANAPQFVSSGQQKEIPVLVETGAASTSFSVSVDDLVDDVTVSLRKPSGSVLPEANGPNVEFNAGSGLRTFKVASPEAGTWTIVVSAGTIRTGNLQVFTYTKHDGTDFWAWIDNDKVFAPEMVRVHATPTHDGRNVLGASVDGQVIRPDGSQVPITLFDDGSEANGDGAAADGIYSAIFGSYVSDGTYTFKLQFVNANGQTYTGERIPDENGVVESFASIAVPPSRRISSTTAIVSGLTQGDTVWFDDALPSGATPYGDAEGWHWVDANPGAFSGGAAHQSRNYAQAEVAHQHYFLGATQTLPVNAGDKLFTYVFLDVNNLPRELMLQWHDGITWDHRAYWGQNRIGFGADGTSSRRYMGPLPKTSQWVRLEVPASLVGLEGSTVSGMAFTLDGGRATWDMAGKTTQNAPPPPTTPPGDFVWVEDSIPAGAIPGAQHDHWEWVSSSPSPFSGNSSHRSFLANGTGPGLFRYHSFTAATTPMQVNPGDVLFTYAYLDPTFPPDEIVLQWHDGDSWEHRAFWGLDFVQEVGVLGTESRRYAGALPPAGQWVRLEIPASHVGLEGKKVSGMAFGYYKQNDKARVSWDKAGKAAQAQGTPRSLTTLVNLWRVQGGQGYRRFTNTDVLNWDETVTGYLGFVDPRQAAATVPMHAFRSSSDFNASYFYTTDRNGVSPAAWPVYVGPAFYVFARNDASTPGTIPLYLFEDGQGYFFTTNLNEGSGKQFHYIAGYVYATNPAPPQVTYNAVADFSSTQNPMASWSYGYKPPGGSFTLYTGTSNYFGGGTNAWALPGQPCCPMVVKNNTGSTYTYTTAPSVVQPADVLNLHPGPGNERSIVRWTAPTAGTFSIQGRFQGIDTGGTTTDVLVMHNGTIVFSGNVNGFNNSVPFSLSRTVAAGDMIEFSVGYGSNGTYYSDSTGVSATITASGGG